MARDLGSLPGAFYTSAADVNARGDAVGVSGLPFGPAVLWTGGDVFAIPGLATAVAINNRGQIVGDGIDPFGEPHAFLFDRGVLTDLGALPGVSLSSSAAADINERGDVAGIAYRAGAIMRMVMWIGGAIQDLGTVPFGEGVVKGINERRQIVGYSQNPSVTRGWVWQEGVFTMLPLPDGATDSFAWDINDRGDIVGVAIGDSTHAVLWPAERRCHRSRYPDWGWGQLGAGDQQPRPGGRLFIGPRWIHPAVPLACGDDDRPRPAARRPAGRRIRDQ